MRTSTDFTTNEILYLDPKILAEVLTLLQQLISWVDNHVFTDAAERAERVAGAETTLQPAQQVTEKIAKTFEAQAIKDGKIIQSRLAPQLLLLAQADESQANRTLDEAEEAFGARSLARERAACGNWAQPETVGTIALDRRQGHTPGRNRRRSELYQSTTRHRG